MSSICSIPYSIYSNYREKQKLKLLITKYEAMIDRIIYTYPDYKNKESDLEKLSRDLEDLEKAYELSRGLAILWPINYGGCDEMLNKLFEQLLEKKKEIENSLKSSSE